MAYHALGSGSTGPPRASAPKHHFLRAHPHKIPAAMRSISRPVAAMAKCCPTLMRPAGTRSLTAPDSKARSADAPALGRLSQQGAERAQPTNCLIHQYAPQSNVPTTRARACSRSFLFTACFFTGCFLEGTYCAASYWTTSVLAVHAAIVGGASYSCMPRGRHPAATGHGAKPATDRRDHHQHRIVLLPRPTR